jgi:pimeloyl-ACP methyl ester carboxylesterase
MTLGGATALRCHLLNGREFRSLTLVDPVATSPWGIGFDSQVRAHEGVFRALPASIHEAVVRAYIRGAHNRVLPETDLIEYVRPWIGEIGQAAFYRQMSQFDLRYTEEVEPLYPNIRCPTLILWGEADQWLPIECGYRLRDRISSARFQAVAGSGHLMQEDAPEAIVGAVSRFLPEFGAN